MKWSLKLSKWVLLGALVTAGAAYCAAIAAIEAFGFPSPSLPQAIAVPPPRRPVTIRLAWNPVTNAVSYRLFWGVASRFYTNSITATGTNAAVTNLVADTLYYFAVTSVNSLGVESLYSEEAANWPRTNLIVTLQPGTASSLAGPWTNIGPPLVMTNPPAAAAFFRITEPHLQTAPAPWGPWTDVGEPVARYGINIRRELQ